MKTSQHTSKCRWDEAVEILSEKYQLYAPVESWGHLDYKLIGTADVDGVVYNKPRPTTPLKSFLLPMRENVSNPLSETKKIIIGVPNCDLKALEILDCMYLSDDFVDPAYKLNRKNTTIISTDCYQTKEHCHCTTYGLNPFPENGADVALSIIGEEVLLSVTSDKGSKLMEEMSSILHLTEIRADLLEKQKEKRIQVTDKLHETNQNLPDYKTSAQLISESDEEIWRRYSQDCVSCGACATSCPTCTCFLLIDRPGFEKIRSIDTCQFPGFERVAAGENPLELISKRFKNRYLCKYIWKPEKLNVLACTGCGRCIEGCIGDINKNELLLELSSTVKTV